MSSGTGVTPLTSAQAQVEEQQAAKEKYLHRMLVGLDQFMNVVTDGDPDETISSRAARAAEKGKPWGIEMSKFLDLFQKDHGPCAQSGDIERAETVVQLEDQSGGIK
jgi:hypothetical protein